MQQGSQEWFEARRGKITASGVGKIFDFTKKGQRSAEYLKYLNQIAWERLTGYGEEEFQNFAMKRGIELEPLAREAYSLATGYDVEEVGFLIHKDHEFLGASPDGLVNFGEGCLEIKCPLRDKFLDFMRLSDGEIPQEYYYQVHTQIAVTGLPYCDFTCFHPHWPKQLKVVRVTRDDKVVRHIINGVIEFNDLVNEEVEKLSA